MRNNLTISIITRTYRYGIWPKRYLQSLQDQTDTSFELIIVDDGLLGNGWATELLMSVNPFGGTQLITHPHRLRRGHALNLALERANGLFGLVLDMNASLRPEAIKRLSEKLIADPRIAACTCSVNRHSGPRTRTAPHSVKDEPLHSRWSQVADEMSSLRALALAFNIKSSLEFGGFDRGLDLLEDYKLSNAFINLPNKAHIDQVLVDVYGEKGFDREYRYGAIVTETDLIEG